MSCFDKNVRFIFGVNLKTNQMINLLDQIKKIVEFWIRDVESNDQGLGNSIAVYTKAMDIKDGVIELSQCKIGECDFIPFKDMSGSYCKKCGVVLPF